MTLPIGTKIPLFEKPTGNATENDVLENTSFSSAKGTGLKGNIKINNIGTIKKVTPNNDTYKKGYYNQFNIIGVNSWEDGDIKLFIDGLYATNKKLATIIYNKIYSYDLSSFIDGITKDKETEKIFKKELQNSKISISELKCTTYQNYLGKKETEETHTIQTNFKPIAVIEHYVESGRNGNDTMTVQFNPKYLNFISGGYKDMLLKYTQNDCIFNENNIKYTFKNVNGFTGTSATTDLLIMGMRG